MKTKKEIKAKVARTLAMLEEEFQILTPSEQREIIGGDYIGSGGPWDPTAYIDSLLNSSNAIFNISNLTSAEKDTLRNSLINIDNTAMGDTLLHDLQNSFVQSSAGLINFSDVALSNGLSGQYSVDSHTIKLGDPLSDGTLKDYNLVHELTHADLAANGDSGNTVENEVEAYLVEGKFVEETGNSLNWGAPGQDGMPPSTASNDYSNAANIITDMGFNNNDFNTMCENFKDGSIVNTGGVYNSYSDYNANNPDPTPYASILFSMDAIENSQNNP